MKEIFIPNDGARFRADFFEGQTVREFEGATCTDRTVDGQGAAAADAAIALVTFLNNVAAGIVAAAIYEALSGKAPWIRIGGKKTEVSKEAIEKELNAGDEAGGTLDDE